MNKSEKVISILHITFWVSIIGSFFFASIHEQMNSTTARAEAGIASAFFWFILMTFVCIGSIPFAVFTAAIRKKIKKRYLLLGVTPFILCILFVLGIIAIITYENISL